MRRFAIITGVLLMAVPAAIVVTLISLGKAAQALWLTTENHGRTIQLPVYP